MTEVIQIVEQTSIVDNYDTEQNGDCKNGDWNYGSKTCGEDCVIYHCSKLAVEPTCGNIGNNVEGEWKLDDQGDSKSPQVQCTYDANTFDEDDIDEYIDKFGEDEQYNTVVMPTFCFQESTECVDNPETGKPWPTCPNMLGRGRIGMQCRNWRSNNTDDADKAQNDYCSDNPGDPVCGCYNRDDDEVYRLVSCHDDDCDSNSSSSSNNSNSNSCDNPYNAGCWYKPCTQPANYLVPSDLINDNPPCPPEAQVCGQINTIISETVSDLPQSAFQDKITCEITENPIPSSNGNGNGGSSSFTIWIIFIVIFVIIIIIVIFFVVYYYS